MSEQEHCLAPEEGCFWTVEGVCGCHCCPPVPADPRDEVIRLLREENQQLENEAKYVRTWREKWEEAENHIAHQTLVRAGLEQKLAKHRRYIRRLIDYYDHATGVLQDNGMDSPEFEAATDNEAQAIAEMRGLLMDITIDPLEEELKDVKHQLGVAKADLETRDTCTACKASLHPPEVGMEDAAPHCSDSCHPDDDQRAEWLEKRKIIANGGIPPEEIPYYAEGRRVREGKEGSETEEGNVL